MRIFNSDARCDARASTEPQPVFPQTPNVSNRLQSAPVSPFLTDLQHLIANLPRDRLSCLARLAVEAMSLRQSAEEAAPEICLAVLCNHELWRRGLN
jgi:hypothetical protein